MIESPFDFSVKFQCQLIRFRKLAKFSRPVLAVVFSFPFSIPRLSTILSMSRHSRFPNNRSFCRIVCPQVMGVPSCLQRWTVFAILDIVQTFFLTLFSLGFPWFPAAKSRTAATAEKTQPLRTRAVDMTGRSVSFLSAMCAVELHATQFLR
jgi:hypothetical protein